MFKVLTLDGGGIRGIFGARFLDLCEANGASISQSFDLIVGTSTGGIIALAAAYEKPMSRVVDLYTTQASKIFPRPSFARKWGILDSKYPNDALIEELQSVFGSRSNFAVPSREVRIPSFNLTTGYSKIFRAGRTNSADRNIFTWQVAAATSAAPTYFPAFEIAGCGLFVDGGIWANNPAVVGLIEAMNLKNSPQDIHILSVGTGERSFRSDQNRTGFISWRSDLVELVFRSQSDGVHQQCIKLKNDVIGVFRRIRPPTLQESESRMDDWHVAPKLRLLADEVFEREWDDVRREFF